MERFLIHGGQRLEGKIAAGAAKNAVLPILAASVLCSDEVRLLGCPHLSDVDYMLEILRELGCMAKWEGDAILINTKAAERFEMPEALSKEMRSSIFMVGPALARFGKVIFTYPGGCEIGLRPIDLHLYGLEQMGARLTEKNGMIECQGKLRGGRVHLDYPSVGATENLMMAAVLSAGTTIIENAAKEPEITDLARFINQMGGNIHGAGTDTIVVHGVDKLHGGDYRPMSDRIVAGTWLLAGAITGGDVYVPDACPEDMSALLAKLTETGCTLDLNQGVRLTAHEPLKAPRPIETRPHPGFPTDMQAQMMATLTLARGSTVLVENVFENRYSHAAELRRMGAKIHITDRIAVIHGVPALQGARVSTRDLRGGAALVLAGLAAEGVTQVDSIRFIDRGYERMEERMSALGARIERV